MSKVECCVCGAELEDNDQSVVKIAKWRLPACPSCRVLGTQFLKNIAGLREVLASKGIMIGVPKR